MAEPIQWVFIDAGGPILADGLKETGVFEFLPAILQKQGIVYDARKVEGAIQNAVNSYAPSLVRAFVWEMVRPNRPMYDRVLRGLQTELARVSVEKPPRLRPEVHGVLRTLANRYRLGVISEYPSPWLCEELQRHELYGLFAMIGVPARGLVGEIREGWAENPSTPLVFDGENAAPYEKTDPRLYECATLSTGVAPDQCVMVGDRMDKDIIPAAQAGMKTLLLRVGDHSSQQPRFPEEAPDGVLKNLRELPDVLRKLDTEKK